MKKKLLVLIAMVLMLVGCKSEKFYLDDEHYDKVGIVEIDNKELKKKEKNEDNFGIFVFLPGCSSCAEFKTVFNEFTEDEDMMVYSISILDVKGTQAEDLDFAPSFIVYKEGKAVDMLDPASDDDTAYFKSADKFKEWLEEYVYLEK